MSKQVSKKGAPLLIIVLLAVTAFAVGAVLVNYWTHQMTKQDIGYVITGMDAYAIQIDPAGSAESYANYLAKTVATTFEPVTIAVIPGEGSTSFSNAMSLTLDGHNIDFTSGLIIGVTLVTDENVVATLSDAKYLLYCTDAGGSPTTAVQDKIHPTIIPDGTGGYTITIPQAEVDNIKYEIGAILPGNGNSNALLLEFSFTGISHIAVGDEDWGTFLSDCVVTFSFSEDV